mgnify:CR=1 FL=1
MASKPREGSPSLHDGIGLAATITRDFVASESGFEFAAEHTRDAITERGEWGDTLIVFTSDLRSQPTKLVLQCIPSQ